MIAGFAEDAGRDGRSSGKRRSGQASRALSRTLERPGGEGVASREVPGPAQPARAAGLESATTIYKDGDERGARKRRTKE